MATRKQGNVRKTIFDKNVREKSGISWKNVGGKRICAQSMLKSAWKSCKHSCYSYYTIINLSRGGGGGGGGAGGAHLGHWKLRNSKTCRSCLSKVSSLSSCSIHPQGPSAGPPWCVPGTHLWTVHPVCRTACSLDRRQLQLPWSDWHRGSCNLRSIRRREINIISRDQERRNYSHVLWLEGILSYSIDRRLIDRIIYYYIL